jgi:hypothetical protein
MRAALYGDESFAMTRHYGESLAAAGADAPLTYHFCETCIHWEPYLYRNHRRRGQRGCEGAGRCEIQQRDFVAVHLCARWENERAPPQTARRLREHPSHFREIPPMGHGFGVSLVCMNHPLRSESPICGVHWKEHQQRPQPCRFPHRLHPERPEVPTARAIPKALQPSWKQDLSSVVRVHG